MSFCGRTRYNLLSKCKIEQWLCVVDIWNGICSQHIQSLFTRFLFSWCYFFVEAGLQVLWVRIYIYSVFSVDRWTPMCVVLLYIFLPLKFHQKLKEKEYQINIISLCIPLWEYVVVPWTDAKTFTSCFLGLIVFFEITIISFVFKSNFQQFFFLFYSLNIGRMYSNSTCM